MSATAYVVLGAAFAIFFAIRGVVLIDPTAAGAPWSFRLLMMPGAAALWPVLVIKLITRRRGAA